MKTTKQATKAELQAQLDQAVFHLAYGIYYTTDYLVHTMRFAAQYPHARYELSPLRRMQTANRHSLGMMKPELRQAVVRLAREFFAGDHARKQRVAEMKEAA